jgi:hypothetical protein
LGVAAREFDTHPHPAAEGAAHEFFIQLIAKKEKRSQT